MALELKKNHVYFLFLIGIDEVRDVFSFMSFCRCLRLLNFIDFNGNGCCLLDAFYLSQTFSNRFCEVYLPYTFHWIMESVAFADVLIAMGLCATHMMTCRISGHVGQ